MHWSHSITTKILNPLYHKDLDCKGAARNVLEVKDCSSPLDHSLDLQVSFLEQFFRFVQATFAVSIWFLQIFTYLTKKPRFLFTNLSPDFCQTFPPTKKNLHPWQCFSLPSLGWNSVSLRQVEFMPNLAMEWLSFEIMSEKKKEIW